MLSVFQFGGRVLITLFTDASYCAKTRIAAYAAWAKADGRTVRHAGPLCVRPGDPIAKPSESLSWRRALMLTA